MKSALERMMDRRQIDALIRSDGVELIFIRRPRVDTSTGGWRWGQPQAISAQRVMFSPFTRRMSSMVNDTELGDIQDGKYILIGRHNLDILPKDEFEYRGDKYTVEEVDPDKEVRVAAIVEYYGGGDADG